MEWCSCSGRVKGGMGRKAKESRGRSGGKDAKGSKEGEGIDGNEANGKSGGGMDAMLGG